MLPFDGNSCRVVLHILDHILALSHCLLTPLSPRILLQVVKVAVVAVVQIQQVRNFAFACRSFLT
jgi:hypothetical protein